MVQTRVSMKMLALASAGVLAAAVHAGNWQAEANLDGLQEVPPNASPAYGLLTLNYNGTTGVLSYDLSWTDLLGNSIAAGIYTAPVGSNGPLLTALSLGAGVGTTTGANSSTVNITPAQAASIIGGGTYVNVRSNVFPSGEIRGQILAVPEPSVWTGLGLGVLGLVRRRRRTT